MPPFGSLKIAKMAPLYPGPFRWVADYIAMAYDRFEKDHRPEGNQLTISP